jgi:hypothetical protein
VRSAWLAAACLTLLREYEDLICCRILLAGFTGIASAAEINGYLLDKSCGDEHGKKQGFAAKHQKSCLPMKVSAESS